MPRIRTIKPSLWRDKAFCSCSIGARLLFIGLISNADDEGRFEADPELIRAAVYPRDGFGAKPDAQLFGAAGDQDVDVWLAELEAAGLARTWTARGERYGDLPGFNRHQLIRHPGPSKLPAITQQDKNAGSEQTTPLAGIYRDPPDAYYKGPAGVGVGVGVGEVRDVGPTPTLSTSKSRSTVRRSDGMKVWEAYLRHHPRAVLTDKRRALIRDRLREGYDPDRLVAAIDGNHRDDHCNGKNDRNRPYHQLELILRDAGHIEQYEALSFDRSSNGHAGPAGERQAKVALERFRAIEQEDGREAAEDWLDSVHTPAVVDRVHQEVEA